MDFFSLRDNRMKDRNEYMGEGGGNFPWTIKKALTQSVHLGKLFWLDGVLYRQEIRENYKCKKAPALQTGNRAEKWC